MKILVTGITGQLGHDVVRELEKRGHEVIGVGRAEMDLTNAAQIREVLSQVAPEAVIHCGAYTAVDRAEDEPELCHKVNAEATGYIAEMCAKLDCKLVYLSTDYIFSGDGERPWEPEDKPDPQNVYGQSKYEGELKIKSACNKYFIVRISWVFGANGNNFVKTMLRLGKERGAVRVVADQFGSPTYTYDLAVLLADMVVTEAYGEYHASNEGSCSWYEFAREIFRVAGMDDVSVTPVTTDEYPAKAARPKNSCMNKEKLIKNGFNKLPMWENALERFLKNECTSS